MKPEKHYGFFGAYEITHIITKPENARVKVLFLEIGSPGSSRLFFYLVFPK